MLLIMQIDKQWHLVHKQNTSINLKVSYLEYDYTLFWNYVSIKYWVASTTKQRWTKLRKHFELSNMEQNQPIIKYDYFKRYREKSKGAFAYISNNMATVVIGFTSKISCERIQWATVNFNDQASKHRNKMFKE